MCKRGKFIFVGEHRIYVKVYNDFTREEGMMRTVNQVSRLTGVSVHTLHPYDASALLKPTKVIGTG